MAEPVDAPLGESPLAEPATDDDDGTSPRVLQREEGYRWKVVPTPELTPENEEVFLNMRLRKLDRQHNGPRKKESNMNYFFFFVLICILFGAGHVSNEDSGQQYVVLKYSEIAVILAWILVAALVIGLVGQNKYKTLLLWMIIFIPLISLIVSLGVYKEPIPASVRADPWVLLGLLIAEALAVFVFLIFVVLYPTWIRSKTLRESFGINRWWSLRMISDWTMTYRGRLGTSMISCWRTNFTCRYEGETNEQGLPHGCGRWIDDSYMGEILSGYWHDGKPVAPFSSRMYGNGDAFAAVRVGYFMGTDDDFDSTKFNPTNEKPPRCGVTSVECSVEGNFYSHLPSATQFWGPHVVGSEEGGSVSDMIQQLIHFNDGANDEGGLVKYAEIRTDDPRGLHVHGHIYAPTGAPFSKEPEQVVIDVKRDVVTDRVDEQEHISFLPKPPSSFRNLTNWAGGETRRNSSVMMRMSLIDEKKILSDTDDEEPSNQSEKVQQQKISGLVVRNWIQQPKKDALIFFPGYNCPLKFASEILGQMMSMTHLSRHVYPIVYAWPCSVVVNPRAASAAAATPRNRENVLELIRGLKASGIQNIHFLSHSMGVQTLLGIFEDKEDGSRSDTSEMFELDSSFSDDVTQQENGDEHLMLCKTLTMINPDFPLDAFVDRAFVSIRRVCNHITVIGDKEDVALQYLSKGGNWAVNRMGGKQPNIMTPRGKSNPQQRGIYRVLGCDFDRLYYSNDGQDDLEQDLEDGKKLSSEINDALVFNQVPPLVFGAEESVEDRKWFDMDVIDVTTLDTNIAGIRHGGFNLNAIILKDLTELIRSGRRASKRSNLLYREGNAFSYCHAPSHVAL